MHSYCDALKLNLFVSVRFIRSFQTFESNNYYPKFSNHAPFLPRMIPLKKKHLFMMNLSLVLSYSASVDVGLSMTNIVSHPVWKLKLFFRKLIVEKNGERLKWLSLGL